MSQAIASEIHPISNLRTLKRVEAIGGPEARAAWNRDTIAAGLEAFEELLEHPAFTGLFCHGNRPTMADCTLIPQLYNATRWGVDYSHLARITAVANTCASLPAFADAHPDRFVPAPGQATDLVRVGSTNG